MKWVTWEQVGVDRMACAWLITTYLDQEAEFLFVPAGQKPAAAGLDLICRGLRLTSPNDQVALERGRLIYDALYAQFASEPNQK